MEQLDRPRGGSGGLSDSQLRKSSGLEIPGRRWTITRTRFRGSIASNEVNGVTTELELVDSLYIRYYKLVVCIAAEQFMQLCPLSRIPVDFLSDTGAEVFGLFRFCIRIVRSVLRNIWRQLCYYLVESTTSRSWNVYICIETGEMLYFPFPETRNVKIFNFYFHFYFCTVIYDCARWKGDCEFSSIFWKSINKLCLFKVT